MLSREIIEKEALKMKEILSTISFPNTIIFDMKNTIGHWFLNYNYFYIRNNYTSENLPFRLGYFSNKIYLNFKETFEKEILESICRYWNLDFKIGKIDLLAWCNKIVEKDTGLFYLYDTDGNLKGLYCHSLNFTEDQIRVSDYLTDYFDFDKAIEQVSQDRNADSHYILPRKKNSELKYKTFEEVLVADKYCILDAELGFIPSLSFYQDYLDTHIIPLTDNSLVYDRLELISDSEGILKFNWIIKNKVFNFALDNSSDYIDFNLYFGMNQVLKALAVKKSFVIFDHNDFGQAYGLAYIDNKKNKMLSSLLSINIVTEN